MINPDPLWIPSADREPLLTDPDLLARIQWIHLGNTGAGQVAPGGRTVTFNGSPVPYRNNKATRRGATFRVGARPTVARNADPGAPNPTKWGRIEEVIGGVPLGGAGLIIPDAQLDTAIDVLVSQLADSSKDAAGVKEWSLAAAQVDGAPRHGVWFFGRPLDRGADSTPRDLVRLLVAAVEVEFAFSFQQDRHGPETCVIWGPDGRLLGELSGGVFLEASSSLDELRRTSSRRIEAGERPRPGEHS